jgi:hypothetical protein
MERGLWHLPCKVGKEVPATVQVATHSDGKEMVNRIMKTITIQVADSGNPLARPEDWPGYVSAVDKWVVSMSQRLFFQSFGSKSSVWIVGIEKESSRLLLRVELERLAYTRRQARVAWTEGETVML